MLWAHPWTANVWPLCQAFWTMVVLATFMAELTTLSSTRRRSRAFWSSIAFSSDWCSEWCRGVECFAWLDCIITQSEKHTSIDILDGSKPVVNQTKLCCAQRSFDTTTVVMTCHEDWLSTSRIYVLFPQEDDLPQTMICSTFKTSTAYWRTERQFISVWWTTLAMLRWTKISPGPSWTTCSAGTRESEQPDPQTNAGRY